MTSLVIGASYSIDLAFSLDSFFVPLLTNIIPLTDNRIRLQTLISVPPNRELALKNDIIYFTNLVNSRDGNPKYRQNCVSNIWCLIVDESIALICQYDERTNKYSYDHIKVNRNDKIVKWFHGKWENSPTEEIIFEDIVSLNTKKNNRIIASVSTNKWDKTFENIQKSIDSIFGITSREFEELIAELLDRQGFDICLTPQTRDGGKDILATHKDVFGRHLYLVQCKHYKPKHPVGVTIVRELTGVVELEHATGGIVVSTSSFTRDAIKLAEKLEYRMSLKDLSDITMWISDALSK